MYLVVVRQNGNIYFLYYHKQCEINGFLLRKYNRSGFSGWQKLWTVLSDLSLLFYRGPNDGKPVARLTLLGYRVQLVSTPPHAVGSPRSAPQQRDSHPDSLRAAVTHDDDADDDEDLVLLLRCGSKRYEFRAHTRQTLIR